MLKQGTYRAWRNLPVGWLTHSIHGRDNTEKFFHVANELLLIMFATMFYLAFYQNGIDWLSFIVIVFFGHTFMWIVDGNFHVYLLDSFKSVKNAGIYKVVSFIEWVVNKLADLEAVNCILIYGSFCRGMFHGRSDLDLRVVRKKATFFSTIFLLYLAVYIRIKSLLKGIPTDLQVVDSFDFLAKQMRDDEKPVVAYCVPELDVKKAGFSFRDIIENPSMVLRENHR